MQCHSRTNMLFCCNILCTQQPLQLFKENEVFEILSDCYESVQLDGDGEILNDIDALLRNNGVTIE